MQAKTHRKKGLEVDPEEMPPLHYGHRVRADHIIIGKDLSKGSEGEQACVLMSIPDVYKHFHKPLGQQTQTSELCKRSVGQGHTGKHSVSQRPMQRPNL